MSMARRGFLLALEGIDGCGKSTQAKLLAAALQARGLNVVLTCEPTESSQGREIRAYFQGNGRDLTAKEELNLFMSDRREHVEEVITPALEEGKLVITDRYYYSSVAYQGALGLDPDRILAQNEVLAPRPELAVILTLPVAQALTRLSGTSPRVRQVSEDPAYLAKVAAIYASLQGPHLRQVDASGPPEAVHAALLNLTREFLEAAGYR
jgi:dTMP kinase